MNSFGQGFIEALKLLISFDSEIYEIIGLSMALSIVATTISSCIGVPLGLFLGLKSFRFKAVFSQILYTLMSLPPVVVGLGVAILLSRTGPFGKYGLIFTPAAMVIAQVILISPIIMGIVFNHTKVYGNRVKDIGRTLGADRWQLLKLLIVELKITILIAIVTGFGRSISEVGAVMIVGGNIKFHTRVMTTFIAMNNNMGNYAAAIAMGLVLLAISFTINAILYHFIDGESHDH